MFEQKHLYWIGVRESEIMCVDQLFSGSISVFGSNSQNNFSFDKEFSWRFDCNIDHVEWLEYINSKVAEIAERDPECQFMLYYPADYPYYTEAVKERVLYLNDMDIITLLENKIESKLWLGNYVPILPYSLESGYNITLEKLKSKFPRDTQFVVQAISSCGGSGTWLLSSQTEDAIYRLLENDKRYIITPYIRKSISVNIHAIVYEEEIILLPPSIQIISIDNFRFSYHGGDFIAYKRLSQNIRDSLIKHAYIIGNHLRDKGYRGVCGMDFLTLESDVYLMEINSRFQASTFLINRALKANRLLISVQHLHKDAFENRSCSYHLPAFNVNYSFYCYSYHKKNIDKVRMLYDIQKEYCGLAECIDNNLDWSVQMDENTYLYEFLFEQSITAAAPDFSCRIDPNIDIDSGIIDIKRWERQLPELKIMLLNHGTRISPNALRSLAKEGGINFQEFYAVDLALCNLFINVPYHLGLTDLSPFVIELDDHENYTLKYWGHKISVVTLRSVDPLGEKTIHSFKYNELSYLGVDRLRIYYRNGCFYKEHGLGCKFCDIETCNQPITFSEIKTVLNDYMGHPDIKHYLIGGGSDAPNSNFQMIIQIAGYIKKHTEKPIYLMCLPPENTSVLKELYQAGITEITFNLEVFDRDIAKSIMPGKGMLPLNAYTAAFKKATAIWGRNGKIRSAFIIGLEPIETLLEGIKYICRLGVSPILSLFKPIPGTPLEYLLPPSNKEIAEIYYRINEICSHYKVELGPSCRYCEDNTLKISVDNFIPDSFMMPGPKIV